MVTLRHLQRLAREDDARLQREASDCLRWLLLALVVASVAGHAIVSIGVAG